MAFEWTTGFGRLRYCAGEHGGVQLWLEGHGDTEEGWVVATQTEALTGLPEAVRQMEIYRKALEPFAETFLTDNGMNLREGTLDYSPVSEVSLLVEEVPAMVEACRLMGLLPAAEDVPPEPTASAEEAFEGNDSLRASGKGAKE